MKKILLIHSSVGLGHKVIVENIAAELSKFPDVKISLLDITKFYEGPLVQRSTVLYKTLIGQFPRVYRFLYLNRLVQLLALPLRLPLARNKSPKLREYLEQDMPDLILTSQTTATALISHLKQKGIYKGGFAVTFSDYHFHPFWVYPGADRFLVMIPEQIEEITKYGYARQRIVVTGMPVDEAYEKKYEPAEILQKYNLSRKPVVLVMGGSMGFGIKESDILALLESKFDIQVAVLTGGNRKLFEKLQELKSRCPGLAVLPELPNTEVAKLFSVARVLVTKPGGLTLAQALASGLPMVLANPLPAVEELNMEYIVNRGAAVSAKTSQELAGWVETLLSDKKFYQDQKERMRLLHVPGSASLAARTLIDML